ncbi:hypothetical protein HYDPIDRAFT_31356 [Hydnomerulius pinastri MD-312]|uniref:Uncharacterized protein n=1 Tax=Hydnomerulius pinastri MD-312 TaxID=994086 RepID=A0A0C9VTZ6_9AGAM|nr:hypothetical protein HYDPIDRAFT_31356 [Hydnomerulius pinastri MD-312]
MIFLPLMVHAAIGVLLFGRQLFSSPVVYKIKEMVTPSISSVCTAYLLDAFVGEPISKAVTFFSRRSRTIFTSPFITADLVLYDPRSIEVMLHTDYCPRYDKPASRPYFEGDGSSHDEDYEAYIDEGYLSLGVPFLFSTSDIRPSPFIDPENTLFDFEPASESAPELTPTSESNSKPSPTAKKSGNRSTTRSGRSSRQHEESSSPPPPPPVRRGPIARAFKARGIRLPSKNTWGGQLTRGILKTERFIIRSADENPDEFYLALNIIPSILGHFVHRRMLGFIHRHLVAFGIFSAISHGILFAVNRAQLVDRFPLVELKFFFLPLWHNFVLDLPLRFLPQGINFAIGLIECIALVFATPAAREARRRRRRQLEGDQQ